MPDAFVTLLATFWFLFQLHSCFQDQDMVDQHLSIYQLLRYVSVVAPMVYQVRQSTHKAEVASSNPGHI